MADKNKINIPHEKWDQCNLVIHSASEEVARLVFIIIPLDKSFLITPIRLKMIISLGNIFEQEITEVAAKEILEEIGKAFIDKERFQDSLLRLPICSPIIFPPNFDNLLLNTEELGWAVAEYFFNKYEKIKKEESFKLKENEK